MRVIVLITILLLNNLIQRLNAQQLTFKTYSVQDGMVANPVRNIFQDSKGFIWVITWEGISKYDGHRFTNYTKVNGLSFNLVNDVYETSKGSLIVAENNGDIDLIGDDMKVRKKIANGITINKFLRLKTGKVIGATDGNGLIEIAGEKLIKPEQSLPGLDYVNLVLWKDSFLVGGLSDHLHILNTHYEELETLRVSPDFINFIFTDSKHNCWLATTKGLKQLITAGERYRIIEPPPQFNIPFLRENVITTIYEDHQRNYWVGTNKGLMLLQSDGSSQLFTDEKSLPSSQVTSVFQDREQNIWVGTMLGIAKLVTKNNFRIYNKDSDFSSNPIDDIYPLKGGNYLIISTGKLYLFNSSGKYIPINPANKTMYAGFIRKEGDPMIYSVGAGQLLKFDQNKLTATSDNFPAMRVAVIDRKGVLFAGTGDGIIRIAGKKHSLVKEIPFRVNNLLLDKTGNIWVGTWQNGLYRIRDLTEGDSIQFKVENMNSLLPGKEIRSLFEDQNGNIWVGTRYNGVVCLDKKRNYEKDLYRFDMNSGLMTDRVVAIAEDRLGNIWLGSNLGIDKLKREGSSYRVYNFSRLSNFYTYITALIPDSTDRLILGTSFGVVTMKDDQVEDLPALPVFVTGIELGSGKSKMFFPADTSKVKLKYFQNQAQFSFAAPGFINEKQITYSYRLLGNDDTAWSRPDNNSSIAFASLQPGHYRFEVRSVTWNGSPGPVTAFSFTITPPFWKTTWFITLCALAFIGLVYMIYRYRIAQFLKLQKVRNRIATDLHDDIGSSLTNISLLSELSHKNIERPEQAETFIQRISEEVNSSSQALDDIVWSINAQNDSLEQMMARMRRYAAEIFEGADISYSFQMQEQFGAKKIDMEQRRDIFLLFKEAINNIYKHAQAKNVVLEMWIKNGRLSIEITDDGKGFDTRVVTSRNGLKNMQTRINRWKGQFDIHSKPGKGTRASFHFPLEKYSLK